MAPTYPAPRPKPRPRRVLLRELAAVRPARVDRAAGVIYGVKVLGFESQNRRRYKPAAVKAALRFYERRVVNLDHPGRPDEDRSAADRVGWLEKAGLGDDGLYADLHVLKSHPVAERLFEAAERNPALFGLSHNARGDGETDADGWFVVEAITEVRSVDLVADPATTKGLFEMKEYPEADDDVMADPAAAASEPMAAEPDMDADAAAMPDGAEDDPIWAAIKTIIGEILDGDDEDAIKIQKIRKSLKHHKDITDAPTASEKSDSDSKETGEEDMDDEKGDKEDDSDDSDDKKESLRRENQALRLCLTEGVQKPSEALLKALQRLDTDDERKALLAERRPPSAAAQPKSSGPGKATLGAGKPPTAKEYAALIRG